MAAELIRIALDPDTDPAVKVRAMVAVLDRSGYGPGVKLEIGNTKWDTASDDVFSDGGADRESLNRTDSRALPGGGGHQDPIGTEDWHQAAWDAQEDADRERDWEPQPLRIYPDANTVRGEVVDNEPPTHLRD